jgi:hypothetical protein
LHPNAGIEGAFQAAEALDARLARRTIAIGLATKDTVREIYPAADGGED